MLGEEKQPLHNCAAKQKTACSIGDAKQKSACPQLHQRRKPLVASEGDLTPTNPLHQIGDEPSIPANFLEVQYMFMWISINRYLWYFSKHAVLLRCTRRCGMLNRHFRANWPSV
jgi:hypothetical protein